MLKLMGLGAAGAILAACQPKATEAPATEAPKEEPTAEMPSGETVELVLMYNANEISEDNINQFNADYAPLHLTRIDTDLVKFFSMIAADQPVDAVRLYGTYMPNYVAKGVCLDLTSYFEASDVLKIDNLFPVNDLFKVEGKRYGCVKDWSPDYSIWINKKLWGQVGVPVPESYDKEINYTEWRELSKKLTQKDGDRTLVFGTAFEPHTNYLFWLTNTLDPPRTIFTEDFKKMNLMNDKEIYETIKFVQEWKKEGGLPSVITPFVSASWSGQDWVQGQAAAVQWGYWFGGMAVSDAVSDDDIFMMRAPTWGKVYSNPCGSGCGIFASAKTKNPDATWKLIEWFMGKEPAQDRAKSGWGVPATKNYLDLMPRDKPWRQQAYDVVQFELANTKVPVVSFSPYTTPDSLMTAWSKYEEPYLKDEISLDEFITNVENEVNVSIQEGLELIGG